MADEHDLGLLDNFADSIGTSVNILRLILSLFSGYPLAVIYRQFVVGKAPNIQHAFFVVCGLGLSYFNFGESAMHSFINIALIYALLFIGGTTPLTVALAFVINMGYLCIGYYYTSMSTDYSVKWTTPHCVLTLRLTGLVWDIYDGSRKPEQLSAEQKETALKKVPSLLEIAGHTFFFGGFLVGPQFSMKRYQNFVLGAYTDGKPAASVTPGLVRLGAGIFYTAVYQISAMFIPDAYLLSQGFQNLSLLPKCFAILIWGKLTLYRYVGVWLIGEGACILTGLTYNGKDENGNELWDGCANVHIRKYESASSCAELILAFNVNTNKWMAKYVFKRLKFLGNKNLSQICTLLFLALWHGLYTGYFVNFLLEFVIMKFEREAGMLLGPSALVRSLHGTPGGSLLVWVAKKAYAQFALSYALVGFCLLSWDNYMSVYMSVYLCGHVVFIGWSFIYPYLRKAMKPAAKQIDSDKDERLKAE